MIEASATRMEQFKQWVYEHRKPLMAGFAALAVIVLIIGLSLMWFVNNKALSTVGKIQQPATLKVLGPNQSAIEQIDLSYNNTTDKTQTDANGDEVAVVKRGFCVRSDGAAFELQVANTTNISGLKIKIYRVSNANAGTSEADIAGVSGTKAYAWKRGTDITDKFTLINPYNQNDDSLAAELAENDQTFENYKRVQKNARPLYRFIQYTKHDEMYQTGDVDNVATNFIIECTWKTRPNVKETDVVYLIARGISSSTN